MSPRSSPQATTLPSLALFLGRSDRVRRSPRPSEESVSSPSTIEQGIVHWLQLERGSSSVLIASGNGATLESSESEDRPSFATMVAAHRSAVNERLAPIEGIEAELDSVRQEVDAFVNSSECELPSSRALAFYRVFTAYTAVLNQLLLDDSALPADTVDRQAKHAFAKLKEALGETRAFVCSVLALSDDAVAHLPVRAFADIVGFMKRHRSEQRNLVAAMPQMRILLEAAFDSPQLLTLQDILLEEFDVGALRKMGLSTIDWCKPPLRTHAYTCLHTCTPAGDVRARMHTCTRAYSPARVAYLQLAPSPSLSPSPTPTPTPSPSPSPSLLTPHPHSHPHPHPQVRSSSVTCCTTSKRCLTRSTTNQF